MPKSPIRRNSNRIPQHDYSTPGQYFVTLLTCNRENIFGDINNNLIVGAADLPPLQYKNNNHRSKMTLSKIIHGVKSTITIQINKINKLEQPIWQRDYHDHIIRNDKSLNKIRKYIIDNPSNWQSDIENPNRIGNIKSNEIRV
ncbi:MAG: hypothetical protein ABII25_10025 [bacterium]